MSDTITRKNLLFARLREVEERGFHGQITIHYANGKPRKIETRQVEDIGDSPGKAEE